MSTKIEWAEEVWNPVTGCTKVSQGCKHCYAERIAKRFWRNGINGDNYRPFTEVRCHPERLDIPIKWKKPRRVFVNSMSDLFHEDVDSNFILQIWRRMFLADQHQYIILTKRPDRMFQLLTEWLPIAWKSDFRDNYNPVPLPNVWLGVSVEDQQTADERIPLLLQTPAAVRFASCEPLLGPVDLTRIPDPLGPPVVIDALQGFYWNKIGGRTGLDWVIVGGESGPGARWANMRWIQQIVDDCQEAQTPVFVKQLGGFPDKRNRIDEWPKELRVREWPE